MSSGKSRGRRGAPKAFKAWMLWAIAAVLVLAGLLVWGLTSLTTSDLHETDFGDVVVKSNMQVEEYGNDIYVMVPVNTDVESVVIDVGDETDNASIENFVLGIDTFVPGEHVLGLSTFEMRFIVDGIVE